MSLNTASIKDQLRMESTRIRTSMAAETCQKASLAICQHIQTWHIFQASPTVLTYQPMRNEVDLSTLINEYPEKNWGIPRVLQGGEMVFHAHDPSRLIRHRYGMLEPDPSCPVIPPETVSLILVPGLAFDDHGWRLGYGGGFYDRFLSQCAGSYAGITYQALLLDEVPHTSFDVPMMYIVTENMISTPLNSSR